MKRVVIINNKCKIFENKKDLFLYVFRVYDLTFNEKLDKTINFEDWQTYYNKLSCEKLAYYFNFRIVK